jgi:hypothetical protein
MSRIPSALVDAVAKQAKTELAPLVQAIDHEGFYPEAYLRSLGELGGFSAAIPQQWGGLGLSLADQVAVTTEVARHCGSTAFMVWCQSTCAWYLLHSSNEAVREQYLNDVARGRLLAGTGMSNTVKHLAGIEKINLRAVRTPSGYQVSGSLPWVSNIGDNHLAIVAAHVENEGYIMFAVRCNASGVTLRRCLPFSGMEGTQTLNLRLDRVNLTDADIIAHPGQFKGYISRIKPGFVLGQTGMGLGIIEASLQSIQDSNETHSHVNVFLDDQAEDLEADLLELKHRVATLADQAQANQAQVLDVLKARLATSELSLRATHSEVLHTGAKGYLMMHGAQRRQREAVFVAIVTPALKHLRKEIHDLEHPEQQVRAA